MKKNQAKPIPLIVCLLPIFFLIFLLYCSIQVWKVDPHIPLLFACIFTMILGLFLGSSWKEAEKEIISSLSGSIMSFIILLLIGVLISTFIISGLVPTIIYYGVNLISPMIFLPLATLLCAIVASSIGSSWSTVATVGLAFLGIGEILNFPTALTAGAILSGACFGDQISPLSDSTNLTANVVNITLFDHVKNMLKPAFITLLISMVIFFSLGFYYAKEASLSPEALSLFDGLCCQFKISVWNLTPLLVMGILIWKKVDVVPTLIATFLFAGMYALLIQDISLSNLISAMHYGYSSHTGNEMIDALLSKGGMNNMLWTISFIMFALAFGAIMKATGIIRSLTVFIVNRVSSPISLVIVTVINGLLGDIILSDQYLSIMLTGNIFEKSYEKYHLTRVTLSRSIEAGATIGSTIVPWNGGGIFMASIFGITAFEYAPFAFFNLLSPIIVICYTANEIKKKKCFISA